jgi:DNA-nicking Smr family endonuclease
MARKRGDKRAAGEDAALWAAVKASARPVQRDTVHPDHLPLADPTPAPKPKGGKPALKRGTAAARPAQLPDPLPDPLAKPRPRDLGHGCAPGVDRRTAERLRKGRMEIQDRLDLHGMSRESGHRATINFVIGAQMSGLRCVLIVTGKGKGILQTELPRWLNTAPLRDRILSFDYARPQDGGTGAVYVLLKRDRTRP